MGKLESPRPDGPVIDGEALIIKGWISPARPLALLIDGNLACQFVPDKNRPEIASAEKLRDDKVGFEIRLRPANAIGAHRVEIADVSTGSRTALLSSEFSIYPREHLPSDPFYIVTHERSGTHFLINTLLRNTIVRGGQAGLTEWYGPYNDPTSRLKPIKHIADNWRSVGELVTMLKTHSDYPLYKAHYHPAKNIYVQRDPRDTLTSFYHYLNSDAFHQNQPQAGDQRSKSMSEFLRKPLTPFLRWCYSLNGDARNVVERWALHTAGWQHAENTRTVHYEDLKRDYEAVLAEVIAFIGLRLQPVRKPVGLFDELSVLPRKGIVGDWKSLFSADDNAFVKKTVEAAGVPWDSARWID